MSDCPHWMKPQPVATYIGSVRSGLSFGLSFYHIELAQTKTTRWLNIHNCGIVVIKKGAITLSELECELYEILNQSSHSMQILGEIPST
jgi:hypothetical protein